MKIDTILLTTSSYCLQAVSVQFQPLPAYYHWRCIMHAYSHRSDPDVLANMLTGEKTMTDCNVGRLQKKSDNPEESAPEKRDDGFVY